METGCLTAQSRSPLVLSGVSLRTVFGAGQRPDQGSDGRWGALGTGELDGDLTSAQRHWGDGATLNLGSRSAIAG
jgi:hypothetical protein